jgi:hypothetical protein
MSVSQMFDRYANVAVIAVLLSSLPIAVYGFVAHSL